jgi:hypothetical protein
MANGGVASPEGLWDRIAEGLSPELPSSAPGAAELLAHLPRPRRVSNAEIGEPLLAP